jgi:hypothetical protein
MRAFAEGKRISEACRIQRGKELLLLFLDVVIAESRTATSS